MEGEDWVSAFGPCVGCGAMFSFNPHRVPSLPVQGVRKPICRGCIDEASRRRVEQGMQPHPVFPDAYSPLPASEL